MIKSKSKPKVLHILVDGNYSGAQNVAISIIKNSQSFCENLYVSKEGNVRRALEEYGISYTFVRKISLASIRNIIKKYKPDIIHSHDFKASIISAFASYNIPIISHIHQNPPWQKQINARTLAYMFAAIRIKKILVVSEAVKEEFVFKKLISQKCRVIGNPVDVNRIVNMSYEDSQIKIDDDIPDIVYIGRLEEEKNPILFIEIINHLKKSNHAIKAAMIGDGSKRANCERYIENCDLGNNVRMFGYLVNPYPVLRKCKVLCIPSKWEGFGLVAIEGMALGKPVVCSNAGGLRFLVNNNVGKICNSISDYCEEINHLISDKQYYDKKSEEARVRAIDLDNTETYFKVIVDYYKCYIKKDEGA